MSVARPVVFLPPVTIVSLSLAELRTVAAATCVSPSPPSSPPPVSSTGWLLSGVGSGSGSGSYTTSYTTSFRSSGSGSGGSYVFGSCVYTVGGYGLELI